MNKAQRNSNRETARGLRAMAHLVICPECGEVTAFGHWLSLPRILDDILDDVPAKGFWSCDKFYGADGRRKEVE